MFQKHLSASIRPPSAIRRLFSPRSTPTRLLNRLFLLPLSFSAFRNAVCRSHSDPREAEIQIIFHHFNSIIKLNRQRSARFGIWTTKHQDLCKKPWNSSHDSKPCWLVIKFNDPLQFKGVQTQAWSCLESNNKPWNLSHNFKQQFQTAWPVIKFKDLL